jgi:hypothetical protein
MRSVVLLEETSYPPEKMLLEDFIEDIEEAEKDNQTAAAYPRSKLRGIQGAAA